MTTTTCPPATYSEAAKVAETVTVDEFRRLLAENGGHNIDLYRPRCSRRIIWNAQISDHEHPVVMYGYCTRVGYNASDAESVGWIYNRPIWHLENIGRIVIVEAVR